MYQPRTYRHWIKSPDLILCNVVVKETDLYLRASTDVKRKAHRLVSKYRSILESYIEQHPSFATSLEPLPISDNAPHIVRSMLEAASQAGVGPMAAVAGAIAEFVGTELLAFSPEIIVENGGDIFLKSLKERVIGIYAGESPLSGKIGIEIAGQDTPLGICCSSGTVGHSLSFGRADAAIAISRSTSLADAAATAVGNVIVKSSDIEKGIELARGIHGLLGIIIIKGGNIGLWGEVKICHLAQ
ncbi:UPF0280 family protein [Chloroflexota bacterium]